MEDQNTNLVYEALWWNTKVNFQWNKSKEKTRILLANINSRLQNKSWQNYIFFFSLPEVGLLKFLLFGLLKIGPQTKRYIGVSSFVKAVDIFTNDIFRKESILHGLKNIQQNSEVQM